LLNRITLMGRLVKDPKLQHTQDSEPIAYVNFSLAVSRDYKDKNGNRITDFFDIIAWRKKAEFVAKYFRKGQLVYLEGRLQRDIWYDKDNNKRVSYKIVTENIHFTDNKKTQETKQNDESTDDLQSSNHFDDLPF